MDEVNEPKPSKFDIVGSVLFIDVYTIAMKLIYDPHSLIIYEISIICYGL